MDYEQHQPEAVLSYAQQLAAGLALLSGGRLVGAYVHRSAALGGWIPGRSDVDLLFVAAADFDDRTLDSVSAAVLTAAVDCPGRELEISVVTAAAAAKPAPPWPYLLHVQAGPAQPGRVIRPESPSHGDEDLLIHYAVCRAAGLRAYGPPPRQLIGAIPRRSVLEYLAGELRWGVEYGSEAYAVLNACRALIYLTDDRIVSKVGGGEAALNRGTGPADLIQQALGRQRGSLPDQPPGAHARTFVLAAAAVLDEAAAGPPPRNPGLEP